jgi:hypothetical protein
MTIATERGSARPLVDSELFDRLAARVAHDDQVSDDYARRIVDQALAFLSAAAVSSERLTPSATVDLGWHAFLLYTRDYAQFCDRVAGRMIHHVPDDGPDAIERDGDPSETVVVTLDAIERAGYVVDPEVWTLSAGKCGPCYEDGNCAASGKDGNENKDNRKKDD